MAHMRDGLKKAWRIRLGHACAKESHLQTLKKQVFTLASFYILHVQMKDVLLKPWKFAKNSSLNPTVKPTPQQHAASLVYKAKPASVEVKGLGFRVYVLPEPQNKSPVPLAEPLQLQPYLDPTRG